MNQVSKASVIVATHGTLSLVLSLFAREGAVLISAGTLPLKEKAVLLQVVSNTSQGYVLHEGNVLHDLRLSIYVRQCFA